MPLVRWSAVVLCVLQGGYMLLDGSMALLTGRYITPGSGAHAGQLGPWAQLLARVGIAAESTGMKLAFVLLGAAWVAVAAGVGTQARWAWMGGVVVAIATLWYLVPGTVISVVVFILLLTPPLRRALGRG